MSKEQAEPVVVRCPACGNIAELPREAVSLVTKCRCTVCKAKFQFANQNEAEEKLREDYRLARDPDSDDSILII